MVTQRKHASGDVQGQLSQLIGFLRAQAGTHVRTMLGFSVIVNLTILAPSFHMLQVYDRVLTSSSVETLVSLTAIVLLALVVYGVAEAARSRVAQRVAAVYAIQMARKMLAKFVHLPGGNQSTNSHLRDFGMVKSFLASRLFVSLFDLPFIPLFVVLLYFVHPAVCVLTIIGLVAMVFVGYLNVKTTEKARTAGRNADSDASGFAQGVFAHGDEIRAHGMLPQLIDIWGGKTADALVKGEEAASGTAFYYALSRAIRQMIQVVTMALGAWLVLQGDMSGGMIFLASMISGKALAPIEQVIGGWETLSKSIAAIGSMETVVGPDKSLKSKPFLPEPVGQLRAIDLHLADASERPIIAGLSLQVMPGQMVAIEGQSGTGKSTLIRLLAGAQDPDSGHIEVDRVKRDRWPIAQWGQIVGYHSEQNTLMPGSLLANVTRFSSEPDMQEAYRAAQSTGAHQVILDLPQGYQTQAGDPKLALSASQRARISLARAFYGKPRVIVLDEPSLYLDHFGEGMLLNALAEAKENGAAIVVATRSSMLRKLADGRLVLRNGRLFDIDAELPPGRPKKLTAPDAPASEPTKKPTDVPA